MTRSRQVGEPSKGTQLSSSVKPVPGPDPNPVPHAWGRGVIDDRWFWSILLFALLIRLVGLDEPLIDQQAWRQTDTAAIARNFVEEGHNLFYPRVDWRGNTAGFVEMNFPLFPYAVSLIYAVVGAPEDWIGRLVAVFCSVASIAFLFLLVRRLFDPVTARVDSFIYAVLPLSWFFGRAFMPEALMMALGLGALAAMQFWLDRGGKLRFALAASLAALSFLVKIPTLCLGLPLFALVWNQWKSGLFRRVSCWLYLVAVLLPSVAWYVHAAGLFDETGLTFGIWGREGYDKWDRSLLTTLSFYQIMGERFFWVVATPVGAVCALVGLRLLLRHRKRESARALFVLAWLCALLVYLLMIPEGNRKLHYYQLPFTPLVALLISLVVVDYWRSQVGSAASRIAVCVIALAATTAWSGWIVSGYHHPRNNVYEYYLSCLRAGETLDRVLPRDARIVVGDLDENSDAPSRAQNPSLLYYSHRKGWQITPAQFERSRLAALKDLGATHFVTATRFAMQSQLWEDLLEMGVSTPSSYPSKVHSQRELMQRMRKESGLDRHFLIVSL